MKIFTFAFKQLCEKKSSLVLMITELTISLIALNIFLSQLSVLFDISKLCRDIDSNMLWTASLSEVENVFSDEEMILPDGIKSVQNLGQVEILPRGEEYRMNNNNPKVYLWPNEYYDALKLWSNQNKSIVTPKNGYLNIVVPKGLSDIFKVGRVYSENIWYNTEMDRGITVMADIYVCGVLDSSVIIGADGKAVYDNMGIWGLDLSGQFSKIPNHDTQYCFYSDKNLNVISSNYMDDTFNSFEDKHNSLKSTIIYELRLPIEIAIAILSFFISAFLGYNLLSLIEQEKRNAIYFMCGSKLSDVLKIHLIQNLLLLGLPIIISSIVILFMYNWGMLVKVSVTGLILSYLLITLIFVISTLIYILNIRKNSVVSYIRKWN